MQKSSVEYSPSRIEWHWQEFGAISGPAMHEILSLRQQVFVVEQRCAYLDADGYDSFSHHLTGRDSGGELVVYARLTGPGSRFFEPSIGRLLTAEKVRRRGLAGEALKRSVDKSFELFPGRDIRISAQLYLEEFYTRHGFASIGKTYLEDGIAHIDMVLKAQK